MAPILRAVTKWNADTIYWTASEAPNLSVHTLTVKIILCLKEVSYANQDLFIWSQIKEKIVFEGESVIARYKLFWKHKNKNFFLKKKLEL